MLKVSGLRRMPPRRILVALSVGALGASLLAVAPPVLAAAPTCEGQVATLVGTEGDDRLVGTEGRDVVVALGGDDEIRTLGGDDLICAGDGSDQVFAGAGDDVVRGNDGHDALRGGAGDDVLWGGRGADRLEGGAGADRLVGGRGAYQYSADWWIGDHLTGGPGDDRLEPTQAANDDVTSTRLSVVNYSARRGVKVSPISVVVHPGGAVVTGQGTDQVVLEQPTDTYPNHELTGVAFIGTEGADRYTGHVDQPGNEFYGGPGRDVAELGTADVALEQSDPGRWAEGEYLLRLGRSTRYRVGKEFDGRGTAADQYRGLPGGECESGITVHLASGRDVVTGGACGDEVRMAASNPSKIHLGAGYDSMFVRGNGRHGDINGGPGRDSYWRVNWGQRGGKVSIDAATGVLRRGNKIDGKAPGFNDWRIETASHLTFRGTNGPTFHCSFFRCNDELTGEAQTLTARLRGGRDHIWDFSVRQRKGNFVDGGPGRDSVSLTLRDDDLSIPCRRVEIGCD